VKTAKEYSFTITHLNRKWESRNSQTTLKITCLILRQTRFGPTSQCENEHEYIVQRFRRKLDLEMEMASKREKDTSQSNNLPHLL
jgi:hypothetical protein